MKMYERSFLVNIIESKLLQTYYDYHPQNQCNNIFIRYLYRYINDNTYVGKHTILYNELLSLKNISSTLNVEEALDNETFTLTENVGEISEDVIKGLNNILRRYNNYKILIESPDRIIFKVNFGWLPPNTGSWLNLLNSETLIDYHIEGITLVPNTSVDENEERYVCFNITELKENNTIAFLMDKELIEKLSAEGKKITFASLLTELQGKKGTILNRIIETDPKNAFYEVGSYSSSYLSAEKSSLIIQIPYDYAFSEYLHVFNVNQSVMINPNNSSDPNSNENWYVAFDDENYDSKFIYNDVNIANMETLIEENVEDIILSDTLIQYIFGDFIWKTTDYKIISYLQNLISKLKNVNLTPNGIWSDKLSKLIREFKTEENINSIFDDDVVNKITEEAMVSKYKLIFKSDPNLLFNEW